MSTKYVSQFQLYSLKVKNNTQEIHLFESKNENDICHADAESACGKVKESETTFINSQFDCIDETDARAKAAHIGRKVCGVCISTLYTTDYYD